MKGTYTIIGSNHKDYYQGRVLWASEFGSNWKTTHITACPKFYRLQDEKEEISIWVRYNREGVKT